MGLLDGFKAFFHQTVLKMQGKALTPEQEEELLSKLIMADFSLKKAQALLEQIKEKGNNVDVIREVLLSEAPPFEPLRDTSVPSVFFIIGVNGVGKTTTVAKLAHMYAKQGKNVVVVGADTFRAAAQDQLSTLVNRMPVTYVGGERGSDSGSILYKALLENPQASVFLVDTAGRIHTSRALIDELSKLIKVGKKFSEEFPQEVLLVLDGTQGIQGYRQAMSFVQGTPITGLVLTKMDSTAKGGMIFSIWDELKIPVKLVCFGQQLDDIDFYSPQRVVDAILGNNGGGNND
ncbi:cell division protein FtsY [Coprothermobacter proteolyticus DSM 5265]|uniref:Cell division protein FtsY n=1 Tax=Coprothermobacter proteolyticus (strain ATCC 35245 / DSM 5265 / OCM 4 / BT) TaxID=309798 RepID=B5Y7W6_COPPD|nr:cell division protein FtsY [Coprothermobacter proteolyticus]ACI17906.1 cell division protein FtsY [Coprothermobacter proteolyticus DSM 5265]